MLPLHGKKVLLVGFGRSGSAAAAYLDHQAAKLHVVDDALAPLQLANKLPAGACILTAAESCAKMAEFSQVVISPGVSLSHPCCVAALAAGKEVVGELELVAGFLAGKYCIGITGTNGKTTVASFIEHLLQRQGINALAIGNIGLPASAVALAASVEHGGKGIDGIDAPFPIAACTHLVIELSSFQLETTRSQILDVALLLNITPDHLDRYEGMQEYAAAKLQIFNCLKNGGLGLMEEQAFNNYIVKPTPAIQTYGYRPTSYIYSDGESLFAKGQRQASLPFKQPRSHDVENFMACYAVGLQLGISSESIVDALASFKKPPHRIEFTAEINGVKFIDDSKGTNIDATYRAVQSLSGPIILIAGGVDKGASYTPWIAQFDGRVRYILAIGEAASKMQRELGAAIETHCFSSLQSAVVYAQRIANPGDTVLLSPGCSSFDLFTDYAHRGREFKRIVHSLQKG